MKLRTLFIVIGLAAAAAPAQAAENLINLSGAFYDFNDSITHTIFKPGYQIGIGYQRFLNDHISMGLSADFMSAGSQDLMFIENISCYSAYLETYYHPLPASRLSPYFGVGLGYLYSITMNVENSKGYADNSVAYVFTAGLAYDVKDDLYLTAQTQYSMAHILSAVSIREIDVGGLATGVGLQYRF